MARTEAPALEGIYGSFWQCQSQNNVDNPVDTFACTVRGGRITSWGNDGRSDLQLSGNVLHHPEYPKIRAHIQPDGSFKWSFGIASRRVWQDEYQPSAQAYEEWSRAKQAQREGR